MAEINSTPLPNRAQRRSAARKVAAAGSAAVLVSVAGTAAVTLSGSVAGAAPTDVTTCDDSGAGSLRDAILYANGHAGPDTITITATCTASGPVNVASYMEVNDDVTIVGPGADNFVLDGGDANQIFYVDGNPDFSLSGVTIQHGYITGDGGGINMADANDVTISSVVFRDNTAGGSGGALYVDGAHDVTITNCLFEDNWADSGGALYFLYEDGLITISNSTFSSNHATASGGGAISVYENPGDFALFNSTITGNTSNDHGPALYLHGLYGDGTILFNTMADNDGSDDGVAVSYQTGSTVTFGGNIIASPDDGVVLYAVTGATVVTYSNDFFGTTYNVTPDASDLNVDPQLLPLADNGGQTPTRALADTSPVINQGPSAWTTFTGDGFDQRGTPHVRVYGGQADMGAFEWEPTPEPPGPTPEPTPEPTFTG